ncbi:pentatricopeptide repeat-containing protein At5g04780, mitochondrial-like isoform X2 [Mangifera indica]|uniref:pentatricopeptide repeat-containing protein At5g04780, mitochondrial-like isoform X2 n=1 Tax=Mangifera indica TaxID=29780 RepID=UPI001CFA67DD|nr:pentatricopeptide repeat-containing protein At5g04780, mitochondrial-like isoform X2 [Mangifera indica]
MSQKTLYYFSSLLRSCASVLAISPAKQTHTQILVHGFLPNVIHQTYLLLAYSKCAFLREARYVFDIMAERNMHSWNILIASYVSNSMYCDALCIFDVFLEMGFRPDHYTLPPVIRACGGIGDVFMGKVFHGWVIRLGFEAYVVVGSSVLDFYVRIEDFVDAKRVFSGMLWKDSVVWNAMISGSEKAGLHREALKYFRNMNEGGVRMDSMVIPSVLQACGGDGDLIKGKEIHGQVVKSILFEGDIAVWNSLIDMYAKCGCLQDAEKVFKNMHQSNLVTWTTMISCYGIHGKGEDSLFLFKKMKDCGFEPNCVTFTAVLSSCSHSGLIDQGRRIFNSISCDYGFQPSVEHYACMVDLLSRFGYLEEALALVKNVNLEVAASVWGALLAGCMMHKNVEIGEIASRHLFDLEPRNPSNHVALCSIYDSLGMLDGVSRTRMMMRKLGLTKSPGCSWITIMGKTHVFYQGDQSHPLTQMMYKILAEIIKEPMLPDDCGQGNIFEAQKRFQWLGIASNFHYLKSVGASCS